MSNEKITKEELSEMLKEYELSDEAVEAVSGGRKSANPKWFDCYREVFQKKHDVKTAERWCDKDYPRYIGD